MSAGLQKKVLKRCRPKLVDEIDEVIPLLEHMSRARVFLPEEVEMISSRPTRTDQIQLFMEVLDAKGQGTYPALRRALGEYYPDLAETLDTVMANNVAMKYGLNQENHNVTSAGILCAAIQKGYHGAVKELVVNAKVGIHHRWKGITPLETACKFNREHSLRLLYNRGAVLSLAALHAAVIHGSTECSTLVLTLLDEARLYVDQQDDQGMTALHHACSKGHSDIARQLLLRQADPLLREQNGRTALHFAACRTDDGCVRTILEYADMNVNIQGGVDANTALHEACIHGAEEDLIKLLIDHGADVDAQNKLMWTPLHCALRSTHCNSSVEALVKYGKPRLTIPDEGGITACQIVEKLDEDKSKIFTDLFIREKQDKLTKEADSAKDTLDKKDTKVDDNEIKNITEQ